VNCGGYGERAVWTLDAEDWKEVWVSIAGWVFGVLSREDLFA
jgi:hypothetical protein